MPRHGLSKPVWLARILLLTAISNNISGAQTLALSSATVPGGGTGVVNLAIASPSGAEPAGVQWTLVYPAGDVAALAVTAGPAATAAGKSVDCAGSSGVYTCIAWGINSNVVANGVLVTVSVTLAGNSAGTNIN